MVTYDDILQAFLVYSASRDQSDWNDLWIISQRRMSALVVDDVSLIFWTAYRNTVRDRFRAMEKWRRMQKAAAILNNARHL